METSITRRDLIWAVAAVALPFLVVTTYLVVAVPNHWNSEAGDFVALIVALAAGVGCVIRIRLLESWKATACVSYAIVMTAVLLLYSLNLVCAVFQECL
jgi:hypothetical protein